MKAQRTLEAATAPSAIGNSRAPLGSFEATLNIILLKSGRPSVTNKTEQEEGHGHESRMILPWAALLRRVHCSFGTIPESCRGSPKSCSDARAMPIAIAASGDGTWVKKRYLGAWMQGPTIQHAAVSAVRARSRQAEFRAGVHFQEARRELRETR